LGDQAELAGPGDGLGAVGRAELAQQVADVLLHRVEADHQLLGDARVRRARGQQRQHLQLAGGQLLHQARHHARPALPAPGRHGRAGALVCRPAACEPCRVVWWMFRPRDDLTGRLP
jgi:hypothetical protein